MNENDRAALDTVRVIAQHFRNQTDHCFLTDQSKHLIAFWMVMLSDTNIRSIVDRQKFKFMILRKFLPLLPFLVGIATLQEKVRILGPLNAVVGIIDTKQVTIVVVFNAKIGPVTTTAVANVKLISVTAAATIPAAVFTSSHSRKIEFSAIGASGAPFTLSALSLPKTIIDAN